MSKFLITFSLLLFSVTAWAQSRVVTGKVQNGADPVFGALVVEKGTSNAAETDSAGTYSINVSDSGKVVLVVSYEGLKNKEIEVGTQNTVDIPMDEDVAVLEEVVIVGYGTVKKSDLTGSVASVKPEELAKVPTANVMESVQGKVAGVDVTRTSGSAGARPNITIRGNRSITAGNDPLYIVDGVQYSNIEDINSNDVESMEVLKDASSTAIYGSRGSNGVVIITTRKGKFNKDDEKKNFKVFFNAYTGMSQAAGFPSAVLGDQFANLKREAKSNRKLTTDTLLSDEKVFVATNELKNVQNGVYTDYVKELLHRGYQNNVQFGVSNATEKMGTYFSLDYYNEKGVLKMDELKRYTARLNLDYKINKIVKVGTQTQLTHYIQKARPNPMPRSFLITPIGTAFDSTGNLILQPFGLAQLNPLADEQKDAHTNDIETTRLFPTMYAELAPTKGLTLRANFSFTLGNNNNSVYSSANSISNFTNKLNSASINQARVNNKNWQFVANYLKQIKSHSVTLTALSELVNYRTNNFSAAGANLPLGYQLYHNLGATPAANVTISSSYEKSSIASFAGRVNYGFDNRYLFTATGRFDGASVLAEGNQWDFFPSVAGAWRIAQEKFMKNQKIFNEIKLRASYGVAGNSGVNPYSSQSRLSRIPFAWDETGAIGWGFSTQLGNPNLKWEKSRTVDFGLDLAILENRFLFTGDVYQTNTSDLLLRRTLPGSTGSTLMLDNVGSTVNQGIELAVTSNNIRKTNFTWSTTATFMRNIEKITGLTGGVSNLDIGIPTRPQILVLNNAVNSFYDYEKIGIWQLNEATEAAKYSSSPGEIKIKDQNGDGKIDGNDRVVVGSNVPKFSVGLNNNFKYKNFDFSFYLFARVGQTVNLSSGATIYDQTGTNGSANVGNFDYWTVNNPTNNLPRPGSSGNYLQTIGYYNGSFLKLRSVNISYTLPKSLVKKYFKAENVKVYATGRNLLTFGKIKNYDPEMNGGFTNPLVRLYTIGINVEF